MLVSKLQHGLRATVLGLGVVIASGILSAGPRAQDAALRVVVTIKPVHSLVAQVMNGLGTPELLVEGKASPHAFALRPSDARALSGADVVVRVSELVEPFTKRIGQMLGPATELVTLAQAPGVELLETRLGTTFEAHEHAEGAAHEGGSSHDHTAHNAHNADDGKHAGHQHEVASASEARDGAKDHDDDHGTVDGHIWLDPNNARAIVRYVAEVLAKRRPDLQETLKANAAKAVAAIDALDGELKATLAPAAGKPFIVFHDAYQYFEHHYGLKAAGAITLNPEVQPSARRLSEIRDTLAKSGATCVFAEPQFSPRIVAAVLEGSGAKAGTLDPLGIDIAAGPGHYAALMRSLATSFEACLVR